MYRKLDISWFPKEMGWKQTVREPDPQERGFAIYVEWCRLQKTCKTKVRAFDTFACIVCHKCLQRSSVSQNEFVPAICGLLTVFSQG